MAWLCGYEALANDRRTYLGRFFVMCKRGIKLCVVNMHERRLENIYKDHDFDIKFNFHVVRSFGILIKYNKLYRIISFFCIIILFILFLLQKHL